MSILSPETEALVRARAARAGKTPDEFIRDALGDWAVPSATVEPQPGRKPSRLAAILAIAEESATRPLLDPRSPDEIIGYDEHGLPA
jgi:antitoxin VapB